MPPIVNGKGFTMVELLVVFAIVGLLSLSSFVYYKSLTRDKVLLSSVDSVQTLLRVAQSNAISGINCGTTNKPGTWIIEFRDDKVNKVNIDVYCKNSITDPLNLPLIKTLTLENNVEIDSITGNICLFPDWPIYIYYAPLSGKALFKNGETELENCLSSNTTLTVTLKDINDSIPCSDPKNSCKRFTVSSGGAINVQ